MKDGEHIRYYENGEILSKCRYLDGERHGEYISYFTSGDIWSKSYHINGKFVSESEWLSYNRNIKLELLGL